MKKKIAKLKRTQRERKLFEEMEKISTKRNVVRPAELLLEEETKAKVLVETKAEETRTSAVSLGKCPRRRQS